MVINWTKIIILIIIIAAFAGIIVGIVLAFRAQCPDGKIFDKTCNKCITKCPDGYKLIPEGDCGSTTCAIDCKDRCRIDNDTCGENCGSDCCNKNESCDFSELTCKTNNCPKGPNAEIFCEPPGVCISSPGTKPFCANDARKCDNKTYKNKCPGDSGFCCPDDTSCLQREQDGSLFCCSPGSVVSNTGCCPKERLAENNKCCPPNTTPQEGGKCCDKPLCNGVCCDPNETCVKNECDVACPGVPGGRCQKGQFCINGNSCVNDPCDWSDFKYSPKSIGDSPLCNSGKLNGVNCEIDNPNLEGVWAYDFVYSGTSGGNSCRTATITAGNREQCSENICKTKIAQKNLNFANYNEKTGICTGVIDCNEKDPNTGKKYLPSVSTTPSAKPDSPNCLSSGVCCISADRICGDYCIAEDEYCLLDSNGDLCNGRVGTNKPEGTGEVASTDPNWCTPRCETGWTGNLCQTATCDGVACNPGFIAPLNWGGVCLSNCARQAIDPKTGERVENGIECCQPFATSTDPWGTVTSMSCKREDESNIDFCTPLYNPDNNGYTCEEWCEKNGHPGTPTVSPCGWFNNCNNYPPGTCQVSDSVTENWMDFGASCTFGTKSICTCKT